MKRMTMFYIFFLGSFLIFQTGACSKPVSSDQNRSETVVEPITTISTAKIHDFAVKGDNLWIVGATGNLSIYEGTGQLKVEGRQLEGRVQHISFIDEKVGWALDKSGQVRSTSDGGMTWVQRGKIGNNPASPLAGQLVFSSPTIGWFADMAAVWRTGDGGDTWIRVYPTDDFSYSTLQAQPLSFFADSSEAAWIGMTNGKILLTNDQGSTWQLASLPVEDIDVESIYCSTNESCWVGTSGGGGLYFTNNFGKNWRQVLDDKIKTSMAISYIFFANTKTGWIAGHPFYSRMEDLGTMPDCQLLKTSNGGLTWNRIDTASVEGNCTRVTFINEDNGWLAGDESVFRTSDGGKSWVKVVQF